MIAAIHRPNIAISNILRRNAVIVATTFPATPRSDKSRIARAERIAAVLRVHSVHVAYRLANHNRIVAWSAFNLLRNVASIAHQNVVTRIEINRLINSTAIAKNDAIVAIRANNIARHLSAVNVHAQRGKRPAQIQIASVHARQVHTIVGATRRTFEAISTSHGNTIKKMKIVSLFRSKIKVKNLNKKYETKEFEY
jgi:hypothetical protein